MEESREWTALRPGSVAQGHEARLFALSGWVHRRGQIPEDTLPVEDDYRRPHKAASHHQSLERRVQTQACTGLLPFFRTGILRIFPVERRHRRRAAADH